jgi:hypothetical protein
MVQITMTKQKLLKKQGTKKAYQLDEIETETITETQYNNIINSASFFRRLGGSCTQQREYTCIGYKVCKDILTSSDKETKTIREFTFNWIN